jgi:AAA domain, putative AbiEii toxin, Type IV TA system
MGPNGAGKSRQLITIRESLIKQSVPCFLLPPQRQLTQINITDRYPGAAVRGNTVEETWSNIVKWIFSPPQQQLQQRGTELLVPPILGALFQHAVALRELEINAQISSLWAWHEDQTRPEPLRLPSSSQLQLIETKLGEILDYEVRIEVPTPPNRSRGIDISFRRKGGSPFHVEQLSSGEQQILLISIFLLGSAIDRFVFLVDEPELYLNEALASRIWEKFEGAFPNAVFLYATHSPAFATRSTITETFVIGMDGAVEKIDKTAPVPSTVLREIVGTRVQLLRSDACPIFCEDELPGMILEDLLSGQNVLPIPVNGCESAVAAVKREGAWERNLRSASPAFCGVIDRDVWSLEETEGFRKANVFCFPRYDAEAVLLDPATACWSLSTSTGHSISRDEWTSIVIATAEDGYPLMLKQLMKHMQRRQDHIIEYDQSGSGITNVRVLPSETLQKAFEDRARVLYSAVAEKDIDGILTMFQGKWLYTQIAAEVGRRYKVRVGPAIQRYRELRTSDAFRHTLRTIPWLVEFHSIIETHLFASHMRG